MFKSLFFANPLIRFEEDKGASGGASGGDAAVDDPTEDKPQVDATKPAKSSDGGKPSAGLMDSARQKAKGADKSDDKKAGAPLKPVDLLDQFWDLDKNEVKLPSLVKSYNDTKRALDSIRTEKKVPTEASGYLKHLTDGKGNVALPDGADRIGAMAADDPIFSGFLESAHRNNLTPDQTRGVFNDVMKMFNDEMPEPFNEAAEMAKLGDNGQVILDTNLAWIMNLGKRGILSENQVRALSIIGGSADSVLAFDKIRTLTGELPLPTHVPVIGDGMPTREELYAMRMDDRYGTDPELTSKVDKYWAIAFEGVTQEELMGLGVASLKNKRPMSRG